MNLLVFFGFFYIFFGYGVFIFLDRKEPDSIYTQILVNKIGFSFDIPHKDFFRLTRAMNFALRALKTERMGNYK